MTVHHASMTWIGLLIDLACGARCPGCGRSSSGAAPCRSCRASLSHVPRAPGAAFVDVGIAARLVRAGKHGHWRAAGASLAEAVASRLPTGPLDVVTWIPADARRRATRGMCLPECVARALAASRDVPAQRLLVRNRSSRSQRGRARSERIANVAGAYGLHVGLDPGGLDGTRVLVVDDIRTTGATLSEACGVLEAAGATAIPFAVSGVPGPKVADQWSTNPVEFPQRARKFCSRSVSELPIGTGTIDERQLQDLNAPRPP